MSRMSTQMIQTPHSTTDVALQYFRTTSTPFPSFSISVICVVIEAQGAVQ